MSTSNQLGTLELETERKQPDRPKTIEVAAKITQWILPIGSLAYASGFLIVLSFYKQYGIKNVDFIEAKYIHVGFLFLMACATIMLPIRWVSIVLGRWYQDDERKGENQKWVVNLLSKIVAGGYLIRPLVNSFKKWKSDEDSKFYRGVSQSNPVKIILRKYFISDWKLSDRHGMHASFPATGSAILMVWTFLLLLTFARPNFAERHPKIFFLNIIIPLIIFAVAIPADLIKSRPEEVLKNWSRKLFVTGRTIIRAWWGIGSVVYLTMFVFKRGWLIEDAPPLYRLIAIFFGIPILILAVDLFVFCLFKLRKQSMAKQRLSIFHWILYKSQWMLFFVQCWLFLITVTKDTLQINLREVFVGKSWHFINFLSQCGHKLKCFFYPEQAHVDAPLGAYVFVAFVLLLAFFGSRSLKRIAKIKEDAALSTASLLTFLGIIFYFTILSYAHFVYPFIPEKKGGGDFTQSQPVHLTLDTRFNNTLPEKLSNDLRANRVVLIESSEKNLYLASTNDAGGPEKWRNTTNKPSIYEVKMDAVVCIFQSE